MKTRRKRCLAACLVILLLGMMLMPLGALAEGTEIPKGYVDPIIELDLKKGDLNGFADFWDRLEEIRLVPYEAFLVHFDAFYKKAENKRFHPISGQTLILKRGEVIPEYRLDVSYGPFNYDKGAGHIYTAEATGEFIMKNIQFGTTKGAGILYNVGGSFSAYDTSESGATTTYGWEFEESRDYGSQYHLPEASYAAVARIEDDPNTMIVRADAYAVTDNDSISKLTGAMVFFRVEGVKLAKASSVSAEQKNSEIDTRADKDKGETGVSIPEALAIVIIGGAAAMAGAGAGGGGGDGGDNNSKRRSRYKMCLRKDFGDGIRYDTQPVTVYARIVELTSEGEEIDRPDLTSAIEIFSGGNLAVEGCSMAGNYMGALVSAKSVSGEENPGTGVVSIRFSGEEGSFQNNVTFRLIGKPYIAFPEQGGYLTMTLPMLLGDGKVYETPVTLHDFLEKPASVRLDAAEGIPLSCELEEFQDIENMGAIEGAGVQSYILKVKNLSPKPEGLKTVKQTFSFGIIAENDQEKAENSLNAELYPEGLSIREVKFDDQGYVLIDTFDNEATEEWGDVVPTGFVLDFVVPEQDDKGRPTVRVLEPQEYSPVFAGLKGTEERTTHLAKRFRYSIQEIPGNLKEYKFAPEEALVEEEGKPYYLTLPISCKYGQEEYILDLPLRLLGGGPGPLTGWDEAFDHMKKVVSKVGGISPELAKMLRENGKKMSTAELRLVTFRICKDAVTYYTRDAAEYEKIAAELDNMLYYAEWLKWFGDQAFSYLISKYYGNTADALLSPAKDFFAAFLGEVLDYLLNDEPFTLDELETIKNITAGVDNLIVNAFDDATSSKNITFKQTCAAVAGFLVWKIAKNIYENRDRDGKVDIYSAITALTADLTAMGVKKIAGNFFDKALKNTAVQNALNKPISKWMQNIAPNVFKGRWDIDKQGEYLLKIVEFKQSDIIKKYLEETFGAGAVKVVEMGAESAQDWLKSTDDSSASPIDLSAWPRISWVSEFTDQNDQKTASLISIDLRFEAIGKFFDHLFGELFGEVPFATTAQSPPVDPPYLPEKSLGTL